MDRWVNKIAVVTGASSGIGASIAEKLVSSGVKVVGIARRKDRIDELAKKLEDRPGKLYSIKADITKESDLLEAFDWIKTNLGPIHILINNAGILKASTLLEGNTETWKATFDTNVLSLCIATREAIKSMKENDIDGHIVHINSVSGHYVPRIKRINVYPASKHAVTALTETLRQELNLINSKIKITSISPGVVKTEIFESGGLLDSEKARVQAANESKLLPEDIADAVLYTLSTPPRVQVHEMIIKPIGEAF